MGAAAEAAAGHRRANAVQVMGAKMDLDCVLYDDDETPVVCD
jgi:hypothetical protein